MMADLGARAALVLVLGAGWCVAPLVAALDPEPPRLLAAGVAASGMLWALVAAVVWRGGPARAWWPVVLILPALLHVAASLVAPTPDLVPVALSLRGLGTSLGLHAVLWAPLVAVAARLGVPGRPIGDALRDGLRRAPDVAVPVALGWQLTQLGLQVVVPGLLLAVATLWLGVAASLSPGRSAWAGSVALLGRHPGASVAALGVAPIILAAQWLPLLPYGGDVALASFFDARLTPIPAACAGGALSGSLALVVQFLLARQVATDPAATS